MVKKIKKLKKILALCILFVLFAFFDITFLHAREIDGIEIPEEFPQTVNVIYTIVFEENFSDLARRAAEIMSERFGEVFPEDRELWHNSLSSILSDSNNISNVSRALENTENEDIFAQAVASDIPIFIRVHVFVNLEKSQIEIRYMFRSVLSRHYVFENSYVKALLSEDDLISFSWLPLRADLNDFLENTIIRPPILIRGPAGAHVKGIASEVLIIPESGYIFVGVHIPAIYRWNMSHSKFADKTGVFMASRENLVLVIPEEEPSPRRSRRSLDWQSSEGVGSYIGVNYSPFFVVHRDDFIGEELLTNRDTFLFGTSMRFGLTPFKQRWGNLGFEIIAHSDYISLITDTVMLNGIDTEELEFTHTLGMQFNILYMKWFFRNSMAVGARVGLGTTGIFSYKIIASTINFRDGTHEIFPTFGMGLSFRYLIGSRFFVEAGVDYTHWFVKDTDGAAHIRPWFGIGRQF